jgi:hypothetical protein
VNPGRHGPGAGPAAVGGVAPAWDGIEIQVSAAVNPSEVEGRVREAILKLFPGAQLRSEDDGPSGRLRISGRVASLDHFAETIARSRIRDAARATMLRGTKGREEGSSLFHLNKQAALDGKVNFVDAAAILGPIVVEIRGPGLMAAIDRLTVHE